MQHITGIPRNQLRFTSLEDTISQDNPIRFIDALRLFKLGFSWGGVTSLVMRYDRLPRMVPVPAERIVRFNVGLEAVPDLIDDLQSALSTARSLSGAARQA